MTRRFTYVEGSQAGPPPALPGLLDLLLQLEPRLTAPKVQEDMCDLRTWVRRARGAGLL